MDVNVIDGEVCMGRGEGDDFDVGVGSLEKSLDEGGEVECELEYVRISPVKKFITLRSGPDYHLSEVCSPSVPPKTCRQVLYHLDHLRECSLMYTLTKMGNRISHSATKVR